MKFGLYGDALKPKTIQNPADILFMDPPYGQGLAEQALPEFLKQGWVDKNTLIIIEEDKKNTIEIPEEFVLENKRSAGRNTFYFIKWEG